MIKFFKTLKSLPLAQASPSLPPEVLTPPPPPLETGVETAAGAGVVLAGGGGALDDWGALEGCWLGAALAEWEVTAGAAEEGLGLQRLEESRFRLVATSWAI